MLASTVSTQATTDPIGKLMREFTQGRSLMNAHIVRRLSSKLVTRRGMKELIQGKSLLHAGVAISPSKEIGISSSMRGECMFERERVQLYMAIRRNNVGKELMPHSNV